MKVGGWMQVLRWRRFVWVWLALVVVGLGSCSTLRFYGQAVLGQVEILRKRVPIEQAVGDEGIPREVREKLALVPGILDFAARELALEANGSYTLYADLEREHVVWIVYAAGVLSTEPKSWWYPVVGEQDYRGYFSEMGAERLASKLRAEGLDVYLGGVDAYSTLGFFRDPLLNTYLDREPELIAELIFHELTHQRIFRKGQTEFNEALAECVARYGTRRWLRAIGRFDWLRRYEKQLQIRRRMTDHLLRTMDELEQMYERSELSESEKLARKEASFERLREQILAELVGVKTRAARHWRKETLNNARLVAVSTYEELVPMFEQILAQCEGDLERFFERVEGLPDLKEDREP